MYNKNYINFKEVSYKFLYNNTLKYMFIRKFNLLNFKICNINLLFWYKHIPSDEFNLFRLYNNIMLIWLLFKQKSVIRNFNSSFRLNVHYYRALLYTNIGKKTILKFFDLFVNGFLPCIRLVSVKFIFFNQKIIVNISDLSFFTSLKVGRFFYVENVTDILLFNFKCFNYEIKNYLSLYKI
jgi:hypothetical protein